MLKGVCTKVGVTKPKKPNSGERKTARVKLSTGRMITAFIPGEGHNIQNHSVVLVKGGRLQDCPGVRYKLFCGAADLVSSYRPGQHLVKDVLDTMYRMRISLSSVEALVLPGVSSTVLLPSLATTQNHSSENATSWSRGSSSGVYSISR